MKNSPERLDNRLEHVEDRNRIEDRSIEIIHLEKQKKKRMKENKKYLRDLWNIIMCTNRCIMCVQKGEEKERKKSGEE